MVSPSASITYIKYLVIITLRGVLYYHTTTDGVLCPFFLSFYIYLSCMDGLASQTKHCMGPSPFAA